MERDEEIKLMHERLDYYTMEAFTVICYNPTKITL